MENCSYNERLFGAGGLRQSYHYARYHWLRRELQSRCAGPIRILELGCFDGKALDFVPHPIERYLGLDAGWEDGLAAGRRKYSGRSEISFEQTLTADILHGYPDNSFDVAVALETLEHIDPAALPAYLREVARVTKGPFLVSVPNEMGPIFLAKYLAKRVWYGDAEHYSLSEVVAATLRQSSKVQRNDHKGFDYRALVRQMREWFSIESVQGVPAIGLPPALSLTIGIVARSG